jgi:hypothetical protein
MVPKKFAQSSTFHSKTTSFQLSINHINTSPIMDQVILFFCSVIFSSFPLEVRILIPETTIINIAIAESAT